MTKRLARPRDSMHLHYNFACIHKTLRVTPAIEAGVADLTALVFIIYVMLTLTMGISALSKGAIYPGIAGIVGPILCWFATGGLKGSFLARPSPQKFARLGAAVTFVALVAVGIGIVYHSGYWVGLFGYGFTGVTWCLVGLVAGWIATPREHADPRSKETLAAGAQERVISKADVDMIFAFARADWERYVHQVGPPEGWTVRLLPLETGTTLARFNQSTGMGASIQPLYTDDQSVPRMIVVGSHYPLGFMRITNEVIKRIEQDTRLDLGPAYSISATHAKMPGTSMEGIDLIVTHDAIDPSRAKEPPESN